MTVENRSSSSCRCCNWRTSLSPNTIQKNSRDCSGRSCRYRRSYLHSRCSVVVTASITALLLLFPSATTLTTTFTHAFRLGFPRRGSASVLDTTTSTVWSTSSSTILHPRTKGSTVASSSSRTVNTCCRLFRQDDCAGKGNYYNRRSKHSDHFCSTNSQKSLGIVAVPSLRRDMTTSSAPTTSLSSEASSFFSTKSSSTEEAGHEREVYTMESLCSYADLLITKNSSSSSQHQNHRFCVYLAGGGSMAVSTLAATPGASSFLLEGRTAYDRHSYLNACDIPDRDTKGKGFSYGGEEAATLASRAALKQALKLTSMDDDLRLMPLTIGIGCASVLVSGEGSSSGKGTVVANAADGLVLTLTIQMKEQERSRFEEDLVLSHLVLRSAEQLLMYREQSNSDAIAVDKEFITWDGDVITERWELPGSSADDDDDDDTDTDTTAIMTDDIDTVVEEAAKRVVDRGEDAVILLPIYDAAAGDGTKKMPVGVRALSQTVLPNGSLVFPGSFNPVHVGHLALANASIKTLEKHEPYVHPRRHNDKPIFFELSLTNADKPSIDPKIVASRVKKFIELASLVGVEDPLFPQQWGIVLTRAPLFEEKLTILSSKVLNRLEGPGDSPRINFVIGTDTLVRILNPKYYPDKSKANMIESLLELKRSGAGFIVGGRLEQSPPQTNDDSSSSARFVSGQEELLGLPDEVASVFTIMEESEFRVDLSSSEIRKEQERK